MENNERDRKLDQWLDEALSKYSAAEPRFGLEQRVLNRVHGEEQVRARRWNVWRWMPAFAAIAAALTIGVAIRPVAHKQAPATEVLATINKEADTNLPKQKVEDDISRGATAKSAKSRNAKEARESDRFLADSKGPAKTREDSTLPEGRSRGVASKAYAMGGSVARGVVAAPRSRTEGTNGDLPSQHQSAVASKDALKSADEVVSVDGASAGIVTAESSTVRRDSENIPLLSAPAAASPVANAKKQEPAAPSIIISAETVEVNSAAYKRLKMKQAQVKSESGRKADANTLDVFGVTLRTEIKQSTAGPNAFPTPAPLSEQEKLVLAAGKKLKDVPAKKVDANSGIQPIEIKDVQIAPLEGPKK
jgi:hypothetical protein